MFTETTPLVSARVIQCGPGLPCNSPRTFADIRALDRALIQEDLPAARAAFNRLQEDSPVIAEALSRHPFPAETRPLRALKALGRCLLSGDLPRARRAFELFC